MQPAFFDRVNNPSNRLGTALENYFYIQPLSAKLGTRTFTVISKDDRIREEPLVKGKKRSGLQTLTNVLKALSYLTVVAPLFMLVGKAIYRSQHKFKLTQPPAQSTDRVDDIGPSKLQGKDNKGGLDPKLQEAYVGLEAALPKLSSFLGEQENIMKNRPDLASKTRQELDELRKNVSARIESRRDLLHDANLCAISFKLRSDALKTKYVEKKGIPVQVEVRETPELREARKQFANKKKEFDQLEAKAQKQDKEDQGLIDDIFKQIRTIVTSPEAFQAEFDRAKQKILDDFQNHFDEHYKKQKLSAEYSNELNKIMDTYSEKRKPLLQKMTSDLGKVSSPEDVTRVISEFKKEDAALSETISAEMKQLKNRYYPQA